MRFFLLPFCITLLFTSVAQASDKAHWGYTGTVGPKNWQNLSPKFSVCGGENQSPVNLTGFIEAELTPLKLSYNEGGKEITNNGHSVQVNYSPGSTLFIGNESFELKQFHFHSPSENHINGKSYPFESHFVHVNKDGKIAVVSVLYNEGEENKALAEFWSQLPERQHETKKLKKAVNAALLLPDNKDYYYFNGSLTTPPCTEGVRWFVFKEALSISKEQLDTFSSVMPQKNNRPLQPKNARPILK
ncbi:MAG: carbonic anhydrase [Gammaproteobacteria bacterium]|nr:MAG: carbonic anhydrase [Gammaproteobacteria bacterium]